MERFKVENRESVHASELEPLTREAGLILKRISDRMTAFDTGDLKGEQAEEFAATADIQLGLEIGVLFTKYLSKLKARYGADRASFEGEAKQAADALVAFLQSEEAFESLGDGTPVPQYGATWPWRRVLAELGISANERVVFNPSTWVRNSLQNAIDGELDEFDSN